MFSDLLEQSGVLAETVISDRIHLAPGNAEVACPVVDDGISLALARLVSLLPFG